MTYDLDEAGSLLAPRINLKRFLDPDDPLEWLPEFDE